MDKYLKMSDMFGAVGVKVRGSNGRHIMCDDILVANCFCTDSANYTAHAINSHDELVENMLHYKQDAELWGARAVKEASRANDLQAEVERLRGALQDAYLDGCHAGWDMSGEGCNAEYGAPEDGAMHDIFVLKSMEYMK